MRIGNSIVKCLKFNFPFFLSEINFLFFSILIMRHCHLLFSRVLFTIYTRTYYVPYISTHMYYCLYISHFLFPYSVDGSTIAAVKFWSSMNLYSSSSTVKSIKRKLHTICPAATCSSCCHVPCAICCCYYSQLRVQ